MKIYDCFMFFNEDLVLDIRLNTLNKFVDYFVIVESRFIHKGEERDLIFNIKKYEKFKNKIIYLIHQDLPKHIEPIRANDSKRTLELKYINNAVKRENSQRDFIMEGLKNANDEDVILISDLDEIPNFKSFNLNNKMSKIIVFEQSFFYYKLDLYVPNFIWHGTKACKKKYLISPQWLRNVKCKKYPKYRIDILFHKKKYNNIQFVKNGGWHFSNMKSPKEIELKYKSYLHHYEFEENPMTSNEIEKIIENKRAIYDLTVDQRENKIGTGVYLENFDTSLLPEYINKNKDKFLNWVDQKK